MAVLSGCGLFFNFQTNRGPALTERVFQDEKGNTHTEFLYKNKYSLILPRVTFFLLFYRSDEIAVTNFRQCASSTSQKLFSLLWRTSWVDSNFIKANKIKKIPVNRANFPKKHTQVGIDSPSMGCSYQRVNFPIPYFKGANSGRFCSSAQVPCKCGLFKIKLFQIKWACYCTK